MQLLLRGPAGGLAEATVRREREAIGRSKLEAAAHAPGDVLDCLDVVAFNVDDADGDVLVLGNFTDEFQLRKLAAGHLEVQFVHVESQEVGKHRCVLAEPDSVPLVITETKVSGQSALADRPARRCG